MREETLMKYVIQYKGVVEGMLTAMVGDALAAEDLFQEMAIVMMRRRAQADEDCRFVAWARAIALNLVRDYWKRESRRRRVRVLDEQSLEAVAGAFVQTDDSLWDDRRRVLSECVGSLPDEHRDLLRDRYERNLSVDELAAATSRRRGAVDTLLYRIRKALSACVEKHLSRAGA